jgi:pSer/pThr/pTyr-binding forkhead associated (FHA) protein
MNAVDDAILLAKVIWDDPQTGETLELVMAEGDIAGIGRLETNAICIKEQHVSRQHAEIAYADGIFVIRDLGSANGVYVNDQRLSEAYPLVSGDVIRLYVPVLRFSALDDDDKHQTTEAGMMMPVAENERGGRLLITNGPQEGSVVPLLLKNVTIGRATSNADWEICIQDPSISRPHARLELIDSNWVLYDLGSANGTMINGTPVNEKGRALHDSDVITMGSTIAVFHCD